MTRTLARALLVAFVIQPSGRWLAANAPVAPDHLFVDPRKGDDKHAGSSVEPVRTLSGAVAKLPADVRQSVTLHLAPGTYTTTGGTDMPEGCLLLRRRTWPGVVITIQGDAGARASAEARSVVLDWEGDEFSILALEGRWALGNVQIGSRKKRQRQALCVEGPGLVDVRDVRVRTGCGSYGGVVARRAGRIHLYGRIEMNEDLHKDSPPPDTFCGIVAEDHGTVKFMQREGASLSIGNGSLATMYFGSIRLGCAEAKITSWHRQANTISIGNSGRIDFHSSEVHLRAPNPENTLIGPEDDGHILAEGAHVILEGFGNENAIVLQKASTLFGDNFEVRGKFKYTLWTMSGSVFAGILKGDVTAVRASTGSYATLQEGSATPSGEVIASGGATIALPSGQIIR